MSLKSKTEYRVRLLLTTGTALPSPMGLRTKLGGEPDWLHAADVPECSQCSEPMAFVGQIDSIDAIRGSERSEFMFGDAGMIYVFYCDTCVVTRSLIQCY